MGYDLHIFRTEDWTKAADKPVTKQEVDALIAADAELAWSTTDYVDMKDSGAVTRYWMITWRGQPCFWWYRDQIQCADPGDSHQAKLVQMARAPGAYALGDEGEIYPLEQTRAAAQPANASPRKQWPLWKQLVAAFLFGCVLLGLKVLIFGI